MNNQFNFDRVTSADQPRNNCELMLDNETLGTTVGSPVITIGAVLFDPYSSDSSEELARRALMIRIDISDSIKYSTGVDGGTIRWWFEQKDEAIKALVGNDSVPVQAALRTLERYCNERGSFMADEFFDDICDFPKCNRFWAKDPDFDMRLLQHYYDHPDLSGKLPWTFHKCRSVRTVQDLAWPEGGLERPEFDVPGVAHNASWDAITQAMTVQAVMRRLGLARDQDVEFNSWKGNDNVQVFET